MKSLNFAKYIFIYSTGKKRGLSPEEIAQEVIAFYSWRPSNWPAKPQDLLATFSTAQAGQKDGYFEVLEDQPGKVKFIMGRYWRNWFDLYGASIGLDENGLIQGVSRDDLETQYRSWLEHVCQKNEKDWKLQIEEIDESKWLVTISTGKDNISYEKQTYTYKVVDDHEIHADVYRQKDTIIQPAILYIHGGGLITGTREWLPQVDLYLKSGYTVISIDHRLAPESKLSAMIEDIEDAYDWIRKHSSDWFIDPGRIAVIGHSSGAFLSLIAGFRLEPRPTAIVSFYGNVDIDGPWSTQPDSFYNQFNKPVAMTREEAFSYVGDRIVSNTPWLPRGKLYQYCRQEGILAKVVTGHDPITEAAWFNSINPIHNISPVYPPTLLLHGEKDKGVPFEQSALLSKKLKHQGVEHEFITNPEWGHAFDGGGLTDPTIQQAYEGVMNFLREHLKYDKAYSTVHLNGLTWMAQNLDYKVADSWCYDNDPANCQKYGRLYTWEAAKQACREVGMRLPTDQEWWEMAEKYGGVTTASGTTDAGMAAYNALIEGGSDSYRSGFAAQLGGTRYLDGVFKYLGTWGGYWSATELDADFAWSYPFGSNKGKLYRWGGYSKSVGRSVRCVETP